MVAEVVRLGNSLLLFCFNFDLIISNHAICELECKYQDSYIPLINNSNYGYITYDNSNDNGKIKNYGGYILKDFINKSLLSL